jgi:hypothetical protein
MSVYHPQLWVAAAEIEFPKRHAKHPGARGAFVWIAALCARSEQFHALAHDAFEHYGAELLHLSDCEPMSQRRMRDLEIDHEAHAGLEALAKAVHDQHAKNSVNMIWMLEPALYPSTDAPQSRKHKVTRLLAPKPRLMTPIERLLSPSKRQRRR